MKKICRARARREKQYIIGRAHSLSDIAFRMPVENVLVRRRILVRRGSRGSDVAEAHGR